MFYLYIKTPIKVEDYKLQKYADRGSYGTK